MDSLFLLVFSLLLVNSCSCFSVNEGQRLPYMTSDIQQISRQSFDYIVVGGGASGCPLAVTLSERFSVLLIERGWSPYNNPLVLQSKKYGLPLIETDEFSSLAQSFVSEDGVANLRGRVLGGSTAINSGFYSRASEDFIERVGWDKKLVKEAYEWVESKIVFEQKELSEWQSVVKDGFVEGGGLPFNGYSLEHVAGTKVGGSIFDGSGRRHSAADLLAYGNLEKITLLLNATVESVIFDDIGNGTRPRAKGIRFINSDGDVDEIFEAYLNKQKDGRSLCGVILSAGALSSPQILMLSGIGPQEHLKTFGILPLVDAREVGRDIKDNPCFSLLLDYSPKVPIADIPQTVGITHDLQTILQSVIRYTTPNETRLRVGAKMVYPISKGKLELESRDPRKNPSVRFNYLVEEKDLDHCVKMGRLVEKVVASNSITLFLGIRHDKVPKKSSEEELREFCKMNVKTFYHYHGGCGVGSVIDEDYKVYGVDGLRIVDGSTLPDSPGTNPMATLLMLGRYQGIKILQNGDDTLITCLAEHGDQYQINHFNT